MSLYQLERERDLAELVEALRRSDDPAIRRRAAEIIGGIFENDDVAESDIVLEDGSDGDPILGAAGAGERETVIDALVSSVKEDDAEGVRAAASAGENVLPAVVDAGKAYATVGEIMGIFEEEYGSYRETATIT